MGSLYCAYAPIHRTSLIACFRAEFRCVDGSSGASCYSIYAQCDHGIEQASHSPLHEAARAATHARVRHIQPGSSDTNRQSLAV